MNEPMMQHQLEPTKQKQSQYIYIFSAYYIITLYINTVDGRNPAPLGMCKTRK